MTYTQTQIDRANAANLEDFLRAQGETLVRSGKEYRWKTHDSLTVCGNKFIKRTQAELFAKAKALPAFLHPCRTFLFAANVLQ